MKREINNVRFGAWVPPMPEGNYGVEGSFITVERYREAKEMGLDFVIGHMEKGPESPDVHRALDCAKAVGLGYVLRWEEMSRFEHSTAEKLGAALRGTIDHEACIGTLIYDEPPAQKFEMMGKVAALYRQVTDKYFYANLLPFDAGEALLGTKTYREHLEAYCKNLKNDMVSMDIYPYRRDKEGYFISTCFLRNLEEVQNICREHGMEHWQFLQGSKPYGIARSPDYFDMRSHIYVSLCYGASVLQYYCYCTPNIKQINGKKLWTSMIDYYGNQTHRYQSAKRLNAEVHAMGEVYMQYHPGWQGVMPVIGTNNAAGRNETFEMLQTPLKSHERIQSIETSEDAIVGAFEGPNRSHAFLIVNYTVPAKRLKNTVSVEFQDAIRLAVYRAGKKSVVKPENGKFEFILGYGEGVFVIPEREMETTR